MGGLDVVDSSEDKGILNPNDRARREEEPRSLYFTDSSEDGG